MIVKFAIIGVILISGAVIFSPELSSLFPNVMDSIKQDLGNTTDNVVEKAENTIETRIEETLDNTASSVNEKIEEIKGNSADLLTQKIDETVFLGINEQSTNDEDESITSIEYMKTHGGVKGVTTVTSTPIQIPSDQLKHTVFYETLSLTTEKQEDGMVVLSYYDTSGKTISVTVSLINSEKELFSGTFFASEFETFIADASDTPHFIDMIVEHQEHGTITSTVFNPAGNTDTTINGVFTE